MFAIVPCGCKVKHMMSDTLFLYTAGSVPQTPRMVPTTIVYMYVYDTYTLTYFAVECSLFQYQC